MVAFLEWWWWVAFPVPQTQGVVYWSSPGQPQWSITRAVRLMHLLESGWVVYLQHLQWKLKRNTRLSKFYETKTYKFNAVKRKDKYKEFCKCKLTSDLDSRVENNLLHILLRFWKTTLEIAPSTPYIVQTTPHNWEKCLQKPILVHLFDVINTSLWPNFHPNTIDYGFWPNFHPNTIDYGFWPNFHPNTIRLWILL